MTDTPFITDFCTHSVQEAAAKNSFPGLEALTREANKWTPVLAIGSNAAPQQLARKFMDMFPHVCIPVRFYRFFSELLPCQMNQSSSALQDARVFPACPIQSLEGFQLADASL